MMKLQLKVFITNILLLCAISAYACTWTAPERWYMFVFDTPSFGDHYSKENAAFWKKYSGSTDDYFWFNPYLIKEAAAKKGDKAMAEYVDALDMYLKSCNSYTYDAWEYPTAEQIAERERAMEQILASARKRVSGPLSDRWLLLQMRANMMLKRYYDNIALWEKTGTKAPEGYVKEMMRNIYANALLNTGNKMEAWNIYADQNDDQSLLWSVRKFTNLAGIRQVYSLYPDAPVQKYLLRHYVNAIQEATDYYYDEELAKMDDELENNYTETLDEHLDFTFGEAYAKLDKDYLNEIKEFVAFADSVAAGGRISDPCMWKAASALSSYYIGDYAAARAAIDSAMAMPSSADTRDMARRIRMLIATSSDDIRSAEFKKWVAGELAWLDGRIAATGSRHLRNARDRILNLGLARNYEARKEPATARLMALCRDYLSCSNRDDLSDRILISTMTGDLFPLNADEIKAVFDILQKPGDDALAQYASSTIKLSDDFKNDLIGTKLLQEGNWAQALPYLEKVSQAYLDRLPIAFYAARRDYMIPAWYGHQTVGDSDYEALAQPQNLKRNVKIDFCNDMLRLNSQLESSSGADRNKAALEMAGALFQASEFGQCWYLSQYGYSVYKAYPVSGSRLAAQAIGLLEECAMSADPKIKAEALFALSYIPDDEWQTATWVRDPRSGDYTREINLNHSSNKYKAFDRLNTFLKSNRSVMIPAISRCDELRQWRAYTHNL